MEKHTQEENKSLPIDAGKLYIKIGDYIAEQLLPLEDVMVVEFGSSYQLQVSNINGKYKVTNGVNGWGNNCLDEFKDAEVVILQEYRNLPNKSLPTAEEILKKHIPLALHPYMDNALAAMEEYRNLPIDGWIEKVNELLLFAELDGTIINGFRTREIVIDLLNTKK